MIRINDVEILSISCVLNFLRDSRVWPNLWFLWWVGFWQCSWSLRNMSLKFPSNKYMNIFFLLSFHELRIHNILLLLLYFVSMNVFLFQSSLCAAIWNKSINQSKTAYIRVIFTELRITDNQQMFRISIYGLETCDLFAVDYTSLTIDIPAARLDLQVLITSDKTWAVFIT